MQSYLYIAVAKVIGVWNFSGANWSIIKQITTFELVVSFIVTPEVISLGSLGAPKRNY